MVGILAGARAQEKATEAAKKVNNGRVLQFGIRVLL
jgi:ribose 5-phosphate isomerase RpiB